VFIRPRTLSILTTRRCTAACDHCSVGAGPRQTDAIPVPRIRALIDEAQSIPTIDRIVFSGGECFLLGDDLDDLIGHASELGFLTRVITNGYWAVNAQVARARIADLCARGLDEMMLSTGSFHQRFVPVQRVIGAARAAAEAGIITRISVEACDQSSFDDALLRDSLADLIASGALYLGRDPWIVDAGGRGSSELTHERYLAESGSRGTGRCAQILNVISITSDQQLMACCGFPSEQLPRLRMGSVAGETLGAMLDAAPNELVKMWLHVAGPAGIAEFVAEHVPGYTLPPAASICQSCTRLQRDARAMEVVAKHGAEAAELIACQYLRLQTAVGTSRQPHHPVHP
jgi:hypothetical protein